MSNLGAIIVATNFTGVPTDEWVEWYQEEHIPERMEFPGWINAQLWLDVDGSKRSLATYDLDDVDVLHHEEYLTLINVNVGPWRRRVHRLREAKTRPSERYECVQINPGNLLAPDDANYLYMVRLHVSEDIETEWNRWYDEEHLPNLAGVPGVLCARRFRASEPDLLGRNYIAMYHLESEDVPRTDEWKVASDTEWTRRMRPHHQRDKILNMFARPELANTQP